MPCGWGAVSKRVCPLCMTWLKVRMDWNPCAKQHFYFPKTIYAHLTSSSCVPKFVNLLWLVMRIWLIMQFHKMVPLWRHGWVITPRGRSFYSWLRGISGETLMVIRWCQFKKKNVTIKNVQKERKEKERNIEQTFWRNQKGICRPAADYLIIKKEKYHKKYFLLNTH